MFGSGGSYWADHVHSGAKCGANSDCGVSAEVSDSDAKYFVGFFHVHPKGDDESSLAGHLEQMAQMAKSLGNPRMTLFTWTAIGHNIETQRYPGTKFVPNDGLEGNLCTACLP